MELDWNKFTLIADRFQYKAKFEDREDLRQDIIVKLAEIASHNGHEPFNEGAMIRVASFTVMSYWRDLKRKPNTLKLSSEINDDDGNSVELWQVIADDRALDLEAWQDAKTWLLGCPRRLVQIAYKRYLGNLLDNSDKCYLQRFREKELKHYQLSAF